MSDLVRPFVMTGGRTRASETLRVETMVQTAIEDAGDAVFEGGRILELCREPHSVAEVAAKLPVPLGVARILIGDLVADQRLVVFQNDPVDIELSVLARMIERVESL
ncbi:MAG: DUF742 domain-containing protein [Actinomycetota bacterium]